VKKEPTKIRHPMGLRHPVLEYIRRHTTKVAPFFAATSAATVSAVAAVAGSFTDDAGVGGAAAGEAASAAGADDFFFTTRGLPTCHELIRNMTLQMS